MAMNLTSACTLKAHSVEKTISVSYRSAMDQAGQWTVLDSISQGDLEGQKVLINQRLEVNHQVHGSTKGLVV